MISAKRPDGWMAAPAEDPNDATRGLCPVCSAAWTESVATFLNPPVEIPPLPEPEQEIVLPPGTHPFDVPIVRAKMRVAMEKKAEADRELEERRKRQEHARPHQSVKTMMTPRYEKHTASTMSNSPIVQATATHQTRTSVHQKVSQSTGIPVEIEGSALTMAPQPLHPTVGMQMSRPAQLPMSRITRSTPNAGVTRSPTTSSIPVAAPVMNPLTAAQPTPALSCEPTRIDAPIQPPKRR